MSRIQLASGDTLYLDGPTALDRLQPMLQRAHGRRGVHHCLCRSVERVPITIVRLGTGESERFTLRSHPGKRLAHDADCDFTDLTERAPRVKAPSETPAADEPIRLEGGVQIRDLTLEPSEPKPPPDVKATHPERQATRLVEVAKMLWERALLDRLKEKSPKRNWSNVAPRLLAAAALPISGGCLLQDILAVIVAGGDPTAVVRSAERFETTMKSNREARRRVLIIGELGGVNDVKIGQNRTAMFLKGLSQSSPWRVLWDQAMIDSTRRRFPIATSLTRRADARVIAIVTGEVDPTGKTLVDVHVCSLVALTREFIPVESVFELDVARALATQQRRFSKPHSPRNGVHPDFLLEDCGPDAVVLEVYGLDTPDYLQSKDRKRALYQDRGIVCWEWNALGGPMPALPPRRI